MVQWSSYNGEFMAVEGPYMILIHQTNGLWFYNCFVDRVDSSKQSWIAGCSVDEPCLTADDAKDRALLAIDQHRQSNS